MSDRASLRTSSQVSALLAQFTKPRSRAPALVGGLTYLVGFVDIATRDLPRITLAVLEAEAFLTWPRLRLFSGARS